MSQGFGPEVKVLFFKPRDRRDEFTIISRLEHWVSHYDPNRQRSVRCGGLRCQLCAWGCKKQLRVVAMVLDVRQKEWFLEFRERHRETLDCYESTVGLKIWVKREGAARNSPVTVKVISEGYAMERDISRFVDRLGLEPQMLDSAEMESHPIPREILDPPERMRPSDREDEYEPF